MPADARDPISAFRETLAPLYAYVVRRCGGASELAEDVTQDTYLRPIAAYQDGMRLEPVLRCLQSVARTLLMNHFRRRWDAKPAK